MDEIGPLLGRLTVKLGRKFVLPAFPARVFCTSGVRTYDAGSGPGLLYQPNCRNGGSAGDRRRRDVEIPNDWNRRRGSGPTN